MDDQSRDRILSEQMLDRLDAIQELVQDVPEIKRIVSEHSERLDEIEATLAVHTGLLREHSATLREHSATLREHGADLKEIKQILGSTVETVAEVKQASHRH